MRDARRGSGGQVTALAPVAAVARRLPARRPRAIVLVYHRIGRGRADPWRLTVDPQTFRGQMETLAREWHPLSLDELVAGLRTRQLPERGIAVTFDDGYADNLELAAPILVEQGIPATLFVATGLIDAGRTPWWDELTSLLLEREPLPPTLTISAVHRAAWEIPPLAAGDAGAAAPSPWDARPGTRLHAFYVVWQALRALGPAAREVALDEIAEWARAGRATDRVVLTREQLRQFTALPGLGLGAHTITHPSLPAAGSAADARAEIAGSAEWLRANVGVEVDQFAYPHGEWSRTVARLVAELGFRAAYTTDGSAITWRSSPYALPRVLAEARAPDEFAGLLAGFAAR